MAYYIFDIDLNNFTMEAYTHNLKIILVDTNENIVSDNDFLDKIKNILY
jgi:hypothetical protein